MPKEKNYMFPADGQPYNEIDPEPLQKEGHTFHCAMRILTGDGECECNKTSEVTAGFSGHLYGNRCAVCLKITGHKEWCRIGSRTVAGPNREDVNKP